MNRRILLLALCAVIAAVAAASLLALPRDREWTAQSPEAVVEFEAAMEASRKLYAKEARARLERTLELDPDFVAAKIELSHLCHYEDPERAEELLASALEADRSGLTDRELFMVERAQLLADLKFDEASKAIEQYLEKHPNDPYVLHLRALEVWQRGDVETAEKLNRRLIEISPNWVLAYNQLGYITMLQGRFAEAEEYFTSYRFIAPDQANPHDSLGELFITLGRYPEAVDSFNRALELRPDFWASYEHLMTVKALMSDWDGAAEAIERGRSVPDAPTENFEMMGCMLDFWRLMDGKEWRVVVDQQHSACVDRFGADRFAINLHRATCQLGEFDQARAIENSIRAKIDEAVGTSWEKRVGFLEPALLHMTGVRLALEGDLEGSATALRAADRSLTYITAEIAIFKLSNNLVLVEVLRAMGEDGQAHKILSRVRTITPELVQQFEADGMKVLGL